jgi:hypothetical protein
MSMHEVSAFDAAAIPIVLAAALGHINRRFLTLASTTGLTVMGAVGSIASLIERIKARKPDDAPGVPA